MLWFFKITFVLLVFFCINSSHAETSSIESWASDDGSALDILSLESSRVEVSEDETFGCSTRYGEHVQKCACYYGFINNLLLSKHNQICVNQFGKNLGELETDCIEFLTDNYFNKARLANSASGFAYSCRMQDESKSTGNVQGPIFKSDSSTTESVSVIIVGVTQLRDEAATNDATGIGNIIDGILAIVPDKLNGFLLQPLPSAESAP